MNRLQVNLIYCMCGRMVSASGSSQTALRGGTGHRPNSLMHYFQWRRRGRKRQEEEEWKSSALDGGMAPFSTPVWTLEVRQTNTGPWALFEGLPGMSVPVWLPRRFQKLLRPAPQGSWTKQISDSDTNSRSTGDGGRHQVQRLSDFRPTWRVAYPPRLEAQWEAPLTPPCWYRGINK